MWTAPAAARRRRRPLAAEKRAVDDRTIAHVLNRMAFGPAPGDIERVRAMGLSRYIDEQLQPQKLADTAMRERLAKFETLTMTSRDIGERYASLEELRRELQLRQPAGAQPGQQARCRVTGSPATCDMARRGAAGRDAGGRSAARRADGRRIAARRAPGGPERAEREELLANLTPEQRQRVMELRKQNQQVLGEMSEQKLLRAVYSERQLEEVLVDFWFNHFNVFAGKGPTRIYLAEYERDAIRPHVLGNFRELLGATAHSPAMLFYLDNWQSSDPDACRGARPMRRNPMQRRLAAVPDACGQAATARAADRSRGDGAAGGGQMSDEERARSAAGDAAAAAARDQRKLRARADGAAHARRRRRLHAAGHHRSREGLHRMDDPAAAPRRRIRIRRAAPRERPENDPRQEDHKGGVEDGEAVLDLLAAHPSTATFIATKLARRFVADDPPKALVERAAAKFRSTNGNLREVVRTILTSPEFTSAEAMRAKVKTPFEFVASALRATGARIEDGTVLVRNLQGLGMPLYMAQPPTGYNDRADVWVNTGALLNRMNFAVALVNNRLRGVGVDLTPIIGRDPPRSPPRAMRWSRRCSRTRSSDATRATIAKGGEVTQVAALTLGSPEFQRR